MILRTPSSLPALLLVACSTLAPGAAAQTSTPIRIVAVERIFPMPYHDPRASIEAARAQLEQRPDDITLLLTIAREASALGVVDSVHEGRLAWVAQAEEAARAAFAIDSTRVDVQYWLAASLGLHADQQGGRTKITLAREAYTRARRTLELEPNHAGAHHIVGRLHMGAKRLGWASRLIARGLGLGGILSEASWESAEHHMRTAADGEPDQLVNRYELGKMLREELDRVEEGEGILQGVADHVPRHALDAYYVLRAQQMLGRLGDGL